jgi:hypothetical protein
MIGLQYFTPPSATDFQFVKVCIETLASIKLYPKTCFFLHFITVDYLQIIKIKVIWCLLSSHYNKVNNIFLVGKNKFI